MNEVYKRKPAPRDWPMPPNIITQQIDVTTNMLATAYCPANVVGREFFIPGTDPISTTWSVRPWMTTEACSRAAASGSR